jgi:hypothetical protein
MEVLLLGFHKLSLLLGKGRFGTVEGLGLVCLVGKFQWTRAKLDPGGLLF